MQRVKTYQINYYGGPNDGDLYFLNYKPSNTLVITHQIDRDIYEHVYEFSHNKGDIMVYNYKGTP